ncbi:MAG: hypothetical protein RLZZ156_741 [Deinococcota bacterium]|jgi:hypothetical protein
MAGVHYIPSEAAEYKLRLLTREDTTWKIADLWEMHGALELEIGLEAPLNLSCSNPVRFGLEPLTELATWVATGRTPFFSRVLGTSNLGTSNHLYHRWRGQHDAVLLLGERDSTIGIQKLEREFKITVLETDDQARLEDQSIIISREALLLLPQVFWDDLNALIQLLGVRLENKEQIKWGKLRPDFS